MTSLFMGTDPIPNAFFPTVASSFAGQVPTVAEKSDFISTDSCNDPTHGAVARDQERKFVVA
jgi:hypothetical protein